MKRRKIGWFLVFMIYSFLAAYAQNNQQALHLTLEDCILKAMENNLGIAIEVLNPELSDLSVSLSKEKFMPTLSFGFARNDENQPSYSWYDSSEEVNQGYSVSNAELKQMLPTGGNLSIEFNTSKYDTNERAIIINPSYRSSLKFSLIHPLLKDFGTKTARREIIVAKNNFDISEKTLQIALQDSLYAVEDAYWNLLSAVENLRINKESLKLAQDLLEKNKVAVEAGTMAPADLFTTEAKVASRQADILRAETEVKNKEDMLKLIINLYAENPQAESLIIIPQESIEYEKKEVSLDEALSVAMQNRPDLQAMQLNLKNSEINMSYAKNQTLPDLNLSASYWSPGVSGTQLIYPSDNPWGVPIGEIPGGRSDSVKDVFGFKHKNWSIGLTLSIPFANFLSRAALAKAKLSHEQSMLQLKNQEQQVFTEIKIAVREVKTNYQHIEAVNLARELAEKQLFAEEEKFKVGHSTNFFVLQYQTELTVQRSQELKAIIDYKLALARLEKSLGISLKNKNIRITDMIGN